MSPAGENRQLQEAAFAHFGHLLTAAQVAELLNVKTSWVYQETRAGRLPHIVLGRYRRYRAEALYEWAAALERGPR